MTGKFELTMKILEGCIQCPAAANHSLHHTFYVETTVDGVRHEEDNTELVKQIGGKVAWNKTITKSFQILEPATPIMVSLTVYQKKTFLNGFNIIGTAHFALADLVRIINKPAVTGKLALHTSKRNMLSGHILVELQVRRNDAPAAPKHEKVSPRSVSAIFSAVPSCDSSSDGGDGSDVEAVQPKTTPKLPTHSTVVPQASSTVSTGQMSFLSAVAGRLREQKRESLVMAVFVAVMVVALVVCTTVQVLG